MVWTLGILNADKPRYAEQFINQSGIVTILNLVQMYGIEADEFDEELESVVVYCLTSSCYENDRDYDSIKHIIPYL
jgi:hypothetical protein